MESKLNKWFLIYLKMQATGIQEGGGGSPASFASLAKYM